MRKEKKIQQITIKTTTTTTNQTEEQRGIKTNERNNSFHWTPAVWAIEFEFALRLEKEF